MTRRLIISVPDSKTNAFIVQINDELKVACSGCGNTGFDTTTVGNEAYWYCTPCETVFDRHPQMGYVGRLLPMSSIGTDKEPWWLTQEGRTVADWIYIWTGLEVEVSIEW